VTVLGAPPPLAEAVLPENVEMVVLDLDGTCLDFHQQLHSRVELAVRQAGERVPVVVASGRMYRSALPWARRLGVRAPLICYQGALVQAMPDPDPGDGLAYGRVVATEILDGATAQRAIAIARENGWHRQAYVDDSLLCEEDRPEARFYAQVGAVPIQFVDDLALAIAGGTVKVVCVVFDSDEAARCRAAMTAALGSRARVTPSYPQFIEIASPRAGKGPAVRRVAAALGVEVARAVAIGDAPNDVDMLETVGFGVAVEGAMEEVLRAADATCAPPQEGGVADVLVALGLAAA
jgi:Cof subfamily protein (haloacid dehalogenase superfamily)